MFSQFGGNSFGGNNASNFNASNSFVFNQPRQSGQAPITSAFGHVSSNDTNTMFNGTANGNANGNTNGGFNQNNNKRGGSRRGNSGRGRGGGNMNNGSKNTTNKNQFSQSSFGFQAPGPSSTTSINYFQNNSQPALSQPPNLPTPAGFRPRSRPPVTTPIYLRPDNNIISNITQKPDPWDVQNQEKMRQIESMQHSGAELESLYRQLQALREVERREMENRGLVDQQDTRKDLKDAIVFVGTCQDMCPTFERVRRAYEKDTKPFEKDANGVVSRELSVKAFSRPAAGQPPPLPSDVRPPHILVSTLRYLIDHVVPQLPRSHPFLWDRTRSIRQDFTYQNYSGPEAIECNELIARIHLLSLHVMLTSDQEYSKQQELEQFNKTLQTLSELYDSNRKRDPNFQSPREAEFRSYLLLSHIKDPDIDRQTQQLPQYIYDDQRIQNAIELRGMMQQAHGVLPKDVKENSANLFAVLFQSVATNKDVSFLTSCLIESHFQDIRFGALGSMSRAYHPRGKPYVLSRLTRLLGFSNEDDTSSFCKSYGLTVNKNDQQQLEVNVAPTSLNAQTSFNTFFAPYIDVKKGDKSWSTCIYDDASAPTFRTSSTPIPKPTPKLIPFQRLPTNLNTNSTFSNTKPLIQTPSIPSPSLFSNPTPTQPLTSVPAFSFGDKSAQPTFSFSAASQNKPDLSKVIEKTPTPLFSLNPVVPIKKEEPVASPAPVPLPPKPKPIIRYVYSEQEVEQEAQKLMREFVGSSLRTEILPSSWKRVQEKRSQLKEQRIQLAIHDELKAMISQLVFEETKNAKAIQMDNMRLCKLAVRYVGRAAFLAKARSDQVARRKQEYTLIAQQLGKPRVLGHNTGDITRLPSHRTEYNLLTPEQRYEQKLQDIKRKKEKAAVFWSSLDTTATIANPLEAGLRKSYSYGNAVLRVSCFCRNWETVVGRWLQAKLSLGQPALSNSKSTTVYVEQLQDDEETYLDLCQLIVLIGLNEVGQPDSDLTYDREAFAAILSRVQNQTKYKIDLLVMYWGDGNASEKSVFEKLGVAEYKSALNSTVFCSVGGSKGEHKEIEDPSGIFQKSLEQLTSNFKGQLSVKGENEKQAKVREQIEQREREQYEAYMEKVRQDEEERNRRQNRIKAMNSLHFFEAPALDLPTSPSAHETSVIIPDRSVTPTGKRKRARQEVSLVSENTDKAMVNGSSMKNSVPTPVKLPQASNVHMSRGVRELRELVASVNKKRTKTAL